MGFVLGDGIFVKSAKTRVSIVILTFNRNDRLIKQLEAFKTVSYDPLEIIIVDNCSNDPVDDIVKPEARAILVRNERNLGAVGRNRGIEVATGDIIVTLDNDVYGLRDKHIELLCELMQRSDLGAVNFRIEEEGTGRITDWCHPFDQDRFADRELETDDISEGAVAFRRGALEQSGLYPEYFFISHEGPDLSLRLINNGWRVIYHPGIVVTHAYDQRVRESWRRYYYDTRNQLWLVLRNLSFVYGLERLVIGWGAMLVYSIRDGYFRYWLTAVRDSLRGAPRAWRDRIPPTAQARIRLRRIKRNKPGFCKMMRRRLFSGEVRI